MTRIILESTNKNDVLLIKKLAKRLKINYKIQDLSGSESEARNSIDYCYGIINKGVDVSNYGDPSEWQRKIRLDRSINFTSQ